MVVGSVKFSFCLDVTKSWSDYEIWWADKKKWLDKMGQILDKCGVQAGTMLYYTPKHKVHHILVFT